MRTLTILAIAVATAVSPAVLAQKKPEVTGAVATAPGQAKAVAVVEAAATVEKIDKASRTVTLKMPDGSSRPVVATEEVRNFDQIKVGDTLTVKYMEALTLELKKGGKAVVARTETGGLDRAAPGQKPGGVAKREVKITANVIAVDDKAMKVTLKGPERTVDMKVNDPEQLKLIKVGDQVEATYTEAVAIALTPAAAPKK
jgi:Cu/Ag efflux protein CusF